MLSRFARKVIEMIDPGSVRARGQVEVTPEGALRAGGDLEAGGRRLEGGVQYDMNQNGTRDD